MGRGRGGRALCNVVVSPDAVSRRRPGGLDRTAGRRTKCLHLAVQLTPVRFPRGMDVRAGRGSSGWNDAEGAVGKSPCDASEFRRPVMAGMGAGDGLSATPEMGQNLELVRLLVGE